MGLAISTSFLADMLKNDAEGAVWIRKQLALVNKLLVANELAPHVEPEQLGIMKPRNHCASFPYSFLHYLRRAFARVREGEPVTPVAEGEDPTADPAVEEASQLFDTHLLCHSDAEGFYVPIDFADVIFDHDDLGLPGGMLGSTDRLMAELVEVAPAINIRLTGTSLADADAAALAAEDDGAPFWRERLVWLALYEAARCSLVNRTMIVFH